MNRADRKRWASATCLEDLGELTAQWCAGGITETPGHAGPPARRPPARETLPYLGLLAEVNRRGFVTENLQAAGRMWNAWVCGFASAGTVQRLSACTAGTRLMVEAMDIREQRDIRYFYRRRCPAAVLAIQTARLVCICDPVNADNAVLWPVLAVFAGAP